MIIDLAGAACFGTVRCLIAFLDLPMKVFEMTFTGDFTSRQDIFFLWLGEEQRTQPGFVLV